MLGVLRSLISGTRNVAAAGGAAALRGSMQVGGRFGGAIAGVTQALSKMGSQFWIGGSRPTAASIFHGLRRSTKPLIRGTAQWGALYGAGSAIEQAVDTNWGQELSPAARSGLTLAATGLKFTGYRKLAQGVMGTSLRAAGVARGGKGRLGQAEKAVKRFMGGFFTKGSALNFAGRMTGRGATSLAMFPLRTAARAGVGAAGMTYAGLRGAASFAKVLGYGGKELSGLAVHAINPLRTTPMKSLLKSAGSRVAASMPSGGFFHMPVLQSRTLQAMKITSPEGFMPIMSPAFVLGGVGAMAKAQSDYYRQSRARVNPSRPGAMGPTYFPGGMQKLRRGAVQNVAPALTLQMHYGRRRVM